jgi:large subunit ribosomal protein L4
MKVRVLNVNNEEDMVELDNKIFDGKVNNTLVHQAVVTYLTNKRRGLAFTKTRGEVRGGGRKPWRQKGTGRARVGSIRSPLWRGGGVVFGPKPKHYYSHFPKKMKVLALKSALNAKLKDKELIVLDNLEVSSYKTKEFLKIIDNLKLKGIKVKFIVKELTDNLKLSSRNLKNVDIEIAANLNVYNILDCEKLIFTRDALAEVENRIKKGLR